MENLKRLQFRAGRAVVLALLVFLSGCDSGEYKAQLKEAVERGEQAYRQYRTGDYATAKSALLDYVHYLERKLADPSFVHVESAKSDVMMNYARLARLETQNNGPDRDMYMQKALAMCEQMKVKRNCSPLDLEAQVDAMDAMFRSGNSNH
jgi:hypothetical protein